MAHYMYFVSRQEFIDRLTSYFLHANGSAGTTRQVANAFAFLSNSV